MTPLRDTPSKLKFYKLVAFCVTLNIHDLHECEISMQEME